MLPLIRRSAWIAQGERARRSTWTGTAALAQQLSPGQHAAGSALVDVVDLALRLRSILLDSEIHGPEVPQNSRSPTGRSRSRRHWGTLGSIRPSRFPTMARCGPAATCFADTADARIGAGASPSKVSAGVGEREGRWVVHGPCDATQLVGTHLKSTTEGSYGGRAGLGWAWTAVDTLYANTRNNPKSRTSNRMCRYGSFATSSGRATPARPVSGVAAAIPSRRWSCCRRASSPSKAMATRRRARESTEAAMARSPRRY